MKTEHSKLETYEDEDLDRIVFSASIGDRKVRATMSREQVEDIKNHHTSIDVVAELEKILIEELNSSMERHLHSPKIKKKEIKRIYSELDPYGEEDWDD